MNLKTIRVTADMLGVSESTVRRAAHDGKIPYIMVGNRSLVDADAAKKVLAGKEGSSIEDVAAATGLKVNTIRRAIREGWMPCEKSGRAFVFQMDEVKAAITNRMKVQSNKD